MAPVEAIAKNYTKEEKEELVNRLLGIEKKA